MELARLADPIVLITSALAVTRLAILITRDSFPFGVLRERVRDWGNKRTPWTTKIAPKLSERDHQRMITYDGQHPVAYLVSCPWCVSMWLAPIVAVLAATGTWWLWISIPLAFSTIAGVTARITD